MRALEPLTGLEALADNPAARRRVRECFPDIAAAGPVDRRTLLQLVAASLAGGGLSACGDPAAEGTAPLLTQPRLEPGIAPGEAIEVATCLELDGYGTGVLATVRDGRAIRIDGNPLHPASFGAADIFSQAEILALHDPERSRAGLDRGDIRKPAETEAMLDGWRAALAETRGQGAAILLPPSGSPTLARLLGELEAAYPAIAIHRWTPLASDEPVRGAELAFGQAVDLVLDLAAADAVLTVGGDLFGAGPGRLRYAADWAARRRDRARPLPRLLALETAPSLAGLRAERRVALSPREVERFLHGLLATLAGETAGDAHPGVARTAEELRQAGPRALVAVGPEQPARVHALAHAVNARLGSQGTTWRAIAPVAPGGGAASVQNLAEALAVGRVTRLLVLGGNPAFDAPVDLDLANLIARCPETLHLGLHGDETARLCRQHVPAAHPLESFGDSRAFDGSVAFRQAAQRRLFPCWSPEEVLGRLAGSPAAGLEVLSAAWRATWGEAFAERFPAALEAGIVEGSAAAPVPVRLREDWSPGAPLAPVGALEIAFAPDPTLHDGRYGRNAWLQELPHPVTKQVWGNAALLGLETARTLGIRQGDLVAIEVGGRRIEAPAWPLASHAEGAVTLPFGGGRREAGAVGTAIGFDAYPLRAAEAAWVAPGRMSRTAGHVALTATQRQFSQEGRPIVRHVATREDGEGVATPEASLYPEWPAGRHAWGMSIDLDACLGCSACTIACQAENNVPAVGPAEAARDRTMHWLRIDRYEMPDGGSAFQPVPCMHCENAPCEVVCPVNATVHSSEGLNDMVYSRCIGTRTCSNNCPYTVRRFNFGDPRFGPHATPADALNPQVTIRARGVMEKCTFCVQRIAATRIAARLEGRAIRDGEIATACENACPTRAITFGDLADPDSRVAQARAEKRSYPLLGELNTRPRTTYLARIQGERPG